MPIFNYLEKMSNYLRSTLIPNGQAKDEIEAQITATLFLSSDEISKESPRNRHQNESSHLSECIMLYMCQ